MFKIRNEEFLDEKEKKVNLKHNFDNIIFASLNIIEVLIPSQIKYIRKSSFCDCKHLQKTKLAKNSKLISFLNMSFYQSSIYRIFIPKHVIKIG